MLQRPIPISVALAVALTLSFAFFFLWPSRPPHPLPDSYRPPTASLPNADSQSISLPTESLADYLQRISPSSDPQPHFWLTISDTYWMDHGTAHLQYFIHNTLNVEEHRQTKLVILCVDQQCVDTARDRGWNAYAGYMDNRPDMILLHTWPKVKGMIDILSSGRDAFFVDSDIYFKRNPYKDMEELNKYDVQIQEEMIDRQVNTGFLFMKAKKQTVEIWQSVLDIDLTEVGRDQKNVNNLLNTFQLRIKDKHRDEGTKMDFTSTTGLKVHVLPKEKFRAYHFEFDRAQYDSTELTYLHMTCADDNNMKDYVAGSYGYFQDLSSRYTAPPPLLTADTFTGSRAQLLQQVRILLAAAHYANRTFVPARIGYVTDLYQDGEGNPLDAMRYAFSVFPFHELQDVLGEVNITELSYIEHAQQTILASLTAPPPPPSPSDSDSKVDLLQSMYRLSDIVDVDMRGITSFGHLISLLLSKGTVGWWHDGRPSSVIDSYSNGVDDQGWKLTGGERGFAQRGIIRLMNWQWANGGGGWEGWNIPKRVERLVETCGEMETWPECGQICRRNPVVRERMENGDVESEEWKWESLNEVLKW